MKRCHLGWAALCLSFLLAGCELVFQAGTGLSGQAREEYLKSIKPYIAYWEKEGMTEEGWQADSVRCRSGGVTGRGIYKPDFDKARLTGETENAAYNRLLPDWERCMLGAGYRYTGDCSSDYMKARPLCGAP